MKRLLVTVKIRESYRDRVYRPALNSKDPAERHDAQIWSDAKQLLNGPMNLCYGDKKITPRITLLRAFGEFKMTFNFESVEKVNPLINISRYIAENFAYDFFLMLNLSRPGCADYFTFRMQHEYKVGNSRHISKEREKISLSNYSFETMCEPLINLKPKIAPRRLSFKDTFEWYNSIRSGTSQIARNHIERVIFSLLHVAKNNYSAINDVVWLAHGLEAFFCSGRSDAFHVWVNRAILFLEAEKDQNQIRKKLRSFQELRSKFVHGDYSTYHPCLNDILDNSMLDITDDIHIQICFPAHLLIAGLQKMIVLKATAIEINETLTYTLASSKK